MIKSTTTPGPPLKTASPKLLKLPAPMMAAMPKNVRSFTVRTLFNPPPCPSSLPSAKIDSIFFVLNNEFAISRWFGIENRIFTSIFPFYQEKREFLQLFLSFGDNGYIFQV